MSFVESRARIQEGVFAALGEDADWIDGDGAVRAVRIRRTERDDDRGWGQGAEIVTTRFIRVRKSEVAQPEAGQIVQVVDEAGEPLAGARYRIIGEPMLNRNLVWVCEAALAG